MENIDLPKQLNTAYNIEDYFNDNCTVMEHDEKEKENIALIKDVNIYLNKIRYYTVMYHNAGMILCHYSQEFSTLLGAMVIYKKLKYALDNNILERMWKDMLRSSKKKYNDIN